MRPALPADSAAIENLYGAAFPPEESAEVAALAVALLLETSVPNSFALVGENADGLTGHIGFSPLGLREQAEFAAYILAPLAVHPGAQGQGLGSRLIQAGLKRLEAQDTAMVFVYGDPAYYGRFGFDADSAVNYTAPYELQYPFGWQALKLPGHETLAGRGTLSCVTSLQRPELW